MRGHFNFLSFLLLLTAAGLAGSEPDGGGTDDWASGCLKQNGCECKWVSGKRTATCESKLGLQHLPEFAAPDKVQVLHLSGNPVGALQERVFRSKGLINLQKIYLRNCSLTHVDATAFEGLAILIELDLSRNQLKALVPGTFEGNIRIRKLWLSHNPLSSLAGFSFPRIPHLRTLDLSHGRINRLGRATFTQLDLLEVVHLNDNHFRNE
jgi:Leucine-rich repeat (LRR) protein